VNHAVRSGRSAAKAFKIFERAAMHLGPSGDKRFSSRIRASEAEYLMTRVNQLTDNSRTDETCGACNENTHFLPPMIASTYKDIDASDWHGLVIVEAFTRAASRVEALRVIRRQSRVEEGKALVVNNSLSQSSADSSASSDPNKFTTALKNAVSSCSAVVITSAQSRV
jgi:hypothetical protein